MADLKWPKDTAAVVKLRAKQQQDWTREQAMLSMRLLTAKDIETFITKEFPADKTREDMLLSVDIFRFYAEQAPVLYAKLKANPPDKESVVKAFAAQSSAKFGGRGGNALAGNDEMFALNEDILVAYLQRGLIDLVTCWSTHKPEVRRLFAREVLDSPKNYATTLELTEEVLFLGAETAIQQWKGPNDVSMADVLKDWLDSEANDSIYTGLAGKGYRQKVSTQVQNYATEVRDTDIRKGAYRLFWMALVGRVIVQKAFKPDNHNGIIAFFKQNVPALTDALRPAVPEAAISAFIKDKLPTLLTTFDDT